MGTFARVGEQFIALYKKNALVAWRNWRATVLRFIAPFLFLVLALLIDKALQANDRSDRAFQDVTSPERTALEPIPSCHSDMYIASKDCTELLYSPINDMTQALMNQVVTRNPIPIKATGYATSDAAQAFLLANPDYAIGAVHFSYDGNESVASNTDLKGFVIQTNTTVKFFKGDFQDPNQFVQLPLQSAVHREIARWYMAADPALAANADSLVWDVGLKTFAHPAIATQSALGSVLGPFVFAAVMFSFVAQIGTVVSEKELGLKQALRTMGMVDSAYWLSWAAWEFTLAFFTAHLICCFGLLLQFDIFLNNNYGLLFFLFFLFQLAMSAFGMFISAFISKTQIAVYIGFVIFIVGWIMQVVVVFGIPFVPDHIKDLGGFVAFIFAIFPWSLLAKGFGDLGSATVSDSFPGISWGERASYCKNIPVFEDQPEYDPTEQYIDFKCVVPLNAIYWIYTGLWVFYLLASIYLDNVLPNEHGVRRPLYYPLLPSYWFPNMASTGNLSKVISQENQEWEEGMDEDVQAEESRVKSLLQHRTGKGGEMAAEVDVRNAVEVFGLRKTYTGSKGFCWTGCSLNCCAAFESCSCKATSDFQAIKGSWFSIPENQLFCLLGPNGAGKTTTINCLTGVLPASAGEALVHGEAISSPGGLERVRAMMGVCPQFDVLWGELNGREHLEIYGCIKGIQRKKCASEADHLLEKVKLTFAASQRTGSYSGGMKRRLSVAIALLGDPKIVYLDEPTTGMDPISRRYVWDIIQEAKIGRAIVLTTHCMEEADILGDRIAIMARGRLRCVGTSIRLKQRFGEGYDVAVSVVPPDMNASASNLDHLAQRIVDIKAYFKENLDLAPNNENRMYISYLVPRERESDLITFLAGLEKEKTRLGVTDVQLKLTCLEEVFIKIARQAEMEAGGQADVQLPDGTILRVPLNEEFVLNPQDNQPYRIFWGTDEEGRLVVMDCIAFSPDEPPPSRHQRGGTGASLAHSNSRGVNASPSHVSSLPVGQPMISTNSGSAAAGGGGGPVGQPVSSTISGAAGHLRAQNSPRRKGGVELMPTNITPSNTDMPLVEGFRSHEVASPPGQLP